MYSLEKITWTPPTDNISYALSLTVHDFENYRHQETGLPDLASSWMHRLRYMWNVSNNKYLEHLPVCLWKRVLKRHEIIIIYCESSRDDVFRAKRLIIRSKNLRRRRNSSRARWKKNSFAGNCEKLRENSQISPACGPRHLTTRKIVSRRIFLSIENVFLPWRVWRVCDRSFHSPCMNTIDWVSYVLSRCNSNRECDE